jgi:hypothetical protein
MIVRGLLLIHCLGDWTSKDEEEVGRNGTHMPYAPLVLLNGRRMVGDMLRTTSKGRRCVLVGIVRRSGL